jgi:hypothetical protein
LFLITSGAVTIIYMMKNVSIIYIVDKSVSKITINRQSWFGNTVLETKLADIVGIKLHAFQVNNAQSYNVSLKLASGKDIYIAAGPIFTVESATNIIENIASFANINDYY